MHEQYLSAPVSVYINPRAVGLCFRRLSRPPPVRMESKRESLENSSSVATLLSAVTTQIGDNSSTLAGDNAMAMRLLAIQVARYCLPVVVFSGTIGNALSFAVLLQRRMRYTSVYVYFLSLACVDMLVLYTSAFKTWIRILTGFEFLHLNEFTCRTTMFVLLVSQHMSAWLIVAVSFDR